MKKLLSLLLASTLFVALTASTSADEPEPPSVMSIISKAYSFYKGAADFFKPSTEELLEDAITEITSEMKEYHARALTYEVTGLTNVFLTIVQNKDSALIHDFIFRSRAVVLPKLHGIIIHEGASQAYSVASAYNTLVFLTVAVMEEAGESQADIDRIFKDVADANATLLGDVECESRKDQNGVPYLKTLFNEPRYGKIVAHLRSGNPLENSVYRMVDRANRYILNEIPHHCREDKETTPTLTFRWISDGPPYPVGCQNSDFGQGCIGSFLKYDPPLPGLHCVNVIEWKDSNWQDWRNNYLCSDIAGMSWSTNGTISGMDCVHWHELREPDKHTWYDNYLCFPKWTTQQYAFKWSSTGKPNDMNCIQIGEPKEPSNTSWNDNYFCYTASGTQLPHSYVTDRFSEEGKGYQWCAYGYAMKGIQCTGRYCDNKRLLCASYMTAEDQQAKYGWYGWLSEESSRNSYYSTSRFFSGLACSGKYCDNIAFELLSSPYLENLNQCRTRPYISEEQRGESCQEGQFVAGIQCSGKYCDNVSLICCNAKYGNGFQRTRDSIVVDDGADTIFSEEPAEYQRDKGDNNDAPDNRSLIYLPLITR